MEKDIFGEYESTETTTKKHTLEGITNELEDITDVQVEEIKALIVKRLPVGRKISDLNLRLDARRIYLKWSTLESVLKMYIESPNSFNEEID